MSADAPIIFYPGKLRLFHIALNIAVAPLLLYLFKIWSWPPTLIHLVVFGITAALSMRFFRVRAGKPRLVFDDAGIHCETSYAAENIRGVKPAIGALKIRIEEAGAADDQVINLWWASKADLQAITTLATARYGVIDESVGS